MHPAFINGSLPTLVRYPHSRRRPLVCKATDGQEADFPSLLLGATEVMSRLSTSSADGAASAQTMFTNAMAALGVSYDAPDSVDIDDVAMPTDPPFNAVHAHMLAGYVFHAYEDPASSCYREVRETFVSTSDKDSGQNPERIVAHYAVPDTNVLSAIMKGVFLLTVKSEMKKDSSMYLVARVNEPIRANCVSDSSFSLLRRKSPVPCYTADIDELVIYAYEKHGVPMKRLSVDLILTAFNRKCS